jgi:CDP-paratose 2-epimerase
MKTILVTGGVGFIGTNVCASYLGKGYKVIAFDNLSRVGSEQNLEWLKSQKGDFIFYKGDVENCFELSVVFSQYRPDIIIHLAAQVTMVDSIRNPRHDFEVNAGGTFNVLEAVRKFTPDSIFLYSSTNKVYGNLEYESIDELKDRYIYRHIEGINEQYPLDFHGPYGCSKGSADSYVRDYARIYGLKTIVFRQSGIYGPHQFGIEEQGWLAWFCISLLENKPVKIFGNGKQVRDVLYIDDLVNAYELAIDNIEETEGQVYNIGGGKNYAISIWQLFEILEMGLAKKFIYSFEDWRAGDQKIYISDISKALIDFGWFPEINPERGIEKLAYWIKYGIKPSK